MRVLEEVKRVLKPGGVFACLETSQVQMTGFKQIFHFYFHYIMPLIGKFCAQSFQEYSWLQESAKDFPDATHLAYMLKEAGFVNVNINCIFGLLHIVTQGKE